MCAFAGGYRSFHFWHSVFFMEENRWLTRIPSADCADGSTAQPGVDGRWSFSLIGILLFALAF